MRFKPESPFGSLLQRAFSRWLIVLDPEVESVEDAEKWMKLLVEDLEEMREEA